MSLFDWLFVCPRRSDSETSSRGGKEGERLYEERLPAADRANLVRLWLAHLSSSELANASLIIRTALKGAEYVRETELQNRSLWYARYLEHLISEADQPLLPPEHFKQSKSMRVNDWVGIRIIMCGEQACVVSKHGNCMSAW